MATFERGAKILFTAAFSPVSPETATLQLSIKKTVNRRNATIKSTLAMDFDSVTNTFTKEIDTSGYGLGPHYWSVYSVSDQRAVQSGEFSLTAGQANPF